MTAPRSVKVTDVFTRRLSDDKLTIESRCTFCGVAIVGSAMQGLGEKEQQHIKICPKISQ